VYTVKVKFSAYKDDNMWDGRKGFEYKWTGEIADHNAAEFLDGLREFITEQASPTSIRQSDLDEFWAGLVEESVDDEFADHDEPVSVR